MPKLSDAELHEFLGERRHLARIATLKPDGAPSVVPVWFVLEDGKILIAGRKQSAFNANIQRDSRVAITVDEEVGHSRKVLIEGRAEILVPPGRDDTWRDVLRRIADRYVDAESADTYLAATDDQPRALIGVDLASAKITTWRMPGEGEPLSGVWHKRYYEPGSKMAVAVESGKLDSVAGKFTPT